MNKLRNVTGFGVDLFGASKFLAKKIYSTLQSDREKDPIAAKQVLIFFQGARAIESSKLWEKVATYFVITKDKKSLIQFIENAKNAINLISDNPKKELLQSTLHKSLSASVAMALALEGVRNESYGKEDKDKNPLLSKYNLSDERIEKLLKYKDYTLNIDALIINLRNSNLVRHNFIKLPLINYTKYAATNEGLQKSYLEIDLIPESNNGNYTLFELDDTKIEYSPRYVHFHEVALSEFRQQLWEKSKEFKNNTKKLISFETKEGAIEDKDKGYIEKSKDSFHNINKSITSKFDVKFDYKHFAKSTIKRNDKQEDRIVVRQISIDPKNRKEKLRVGLVNMKLDDRHIKESYLKNPIFDKQRKEDINHLLNLIERETWKHGKLDMIVLPEVSIPYKALTWLCQYALQHQVIMVFGLEHWIVNNTAFNFMVTLLPFEIKNKEENIGGYKALLPIFRIKNYYSPKEKEILERYRYEIPEPFPCEYHLFNWKGINFAAFNCFELADIKHRAMFKDEVDLIVACENNPDTNYFSNIVESCIRDFHCYLIQANNSKFGDTRISKPVNNVEINQIKIKGGINAAVLIDEIDIKNLRDFQIQEYSSENKDYKPTPPGFDRVKAMNRRGKNLNE